ncbi:borealin [Scyliorhinus canicula]|uniref:borealin n=1 Tax=Scyliorhinus canicula TaxID=7830 RepID=UPI0018F4B204|nr:borealin [Scyliorhinus canicula]XP_038657169.1 borealin [Scyliorhinus canicula]XP_038657174.1 borealin [Scyliorhinus canicula]XP_038657180.1 borealin [Scyliorhinus canicula]
MPCRRKATGRKKNAMELKKYEKLQAFLNDFDIEVERRKKEMENAFNDLLLTVDNSYSRAIMKLPLAVRKMPFQDYLAMGGGSKAVAEVEQKHIVAARLEVEAMDAEVLKDAAPLRITKKRKLGKSKARNYCDEIVSEDENLPPVTKMFRKAKNGGTISVCATGTRTKRTSRTKGLYSNTSDIWGPTPLITPKFDSRLPKTSTRLRKAGENVFSLSGSPLAEPREMTISIPIKSGQNIQVVASKINETDFTQLDDKTFESFEKLSRQLNKMLKTRK